MIWAITTVDLNSNYRLCTFRPRKWSFSHVANNNGVLSSKHEDYKPKADWDLDKQNWDLDIRKGRLPSTIFCHWIWLRVWVRLLMSLPTWMSREKRCLGCFRDEITKATSLGSGLYNESPKVFGLCINAVIIPQMGWLTDSCLVFRAIARVAFNHFDMFWSWLSFDELPQL